MVASRRVGISRSGAAGPTGSGGSRGDPAGPPQAGDVDGVRLGSRRGARSIRPRSTASKPWSTSAGWACSTPRGRSSVARASSPRGSAPRGPWPRRSPHGREGRRPVLIQASGIARYGTVANAEPFTEDDLAAADFLAQVTVQWEGAAQPAAEAGVARGLPADQPGDGSQRRRLRTDETGLVGRSRRDLGDGRTAHADDQPRRLSRHRASGPSTRRTPPGRTT